MIADFVLKCDCSFPDKFFVTGRFQEAGTKVGPDQLGPPLRVGSTRIVSDHEKKNIKLNEIETFIHLKVKIPVKNGPNKERLATFLRVVLCSQAAILYS